MPASCLSSLRRTDLIPDQVQDFYPTPGTLSTCMFYTGIDPSAKERVYVPSDPEEKRLQRAMLHFNKPENADLVRKALRLLGRTDLIGYGPEALVRPESEKNRKGVRTDPGRRDNRGATDRKSRGQAGGARQFGGRAVVHLPRYKEKKQEKKRFSRKGGRKRRRNPQGGQKREPVRRRRRRKGQKKMSILHELPQIVKRAGRSVTDCCGVQRKKLRRKKRRKYLFLPEAAAGTGTVSSSDEPEEVRGLFLSLMNRKIVRDVFFCAITRGFSRRKSRTVLWCRP